MSSSIIPTDVDIEQPHAKENIIPDRPIHTKSANDLFESSPWLQRWLGCDFPLLPEEAMEAYHKHHLENVNPFVFIPMLIVYLLELIFRCGIIVGFSKFGDLSRNQAIVLVVSVICTLTSNFFFFVYLIVHALRLTGRDVMLGDLTGRLKYLPLRLEESVFFLGVIAWSLFLIARVLRGQCEPGTSLWEQQTCNPFASQGGIPAELVYSLYLIPMSVQLAMKNISIRNVVLGNLTTLAAVLFCICYQQAWNDYFIVLNWMIVSNISFEVLRTHRVDYKNLMKEKEQQVHRSLLLQTIHRSTICLKTILTGIQTL